jgi:hypothetical protein
MILDAFKQYIEGQNEKSYDKAISNTDRYQSRMGFPDGYL